MADDVKNFPKGRVSMEGGDLVDATNITWTGTDNRKTVPTLRQNPAGVTDGAREERLEFESAISEAGFERSYMKWWRSGKMVSARVKVPGLTIEVKGKLTAPTISSNVDSFITFKVAILGRGSGQ